MSYHCGMASGILEVQCPCCSTILKVDASTGSIISHKQQEKAPAIEDLAAAVRNLKTQAEEREQAFQKSFAEQKTRQSVLDKKFGELLKEAKEKPDEKPRRAFDFD